MKRSMISFASPRCSLVAGLSVSSLTGLIEMLSSSGSIVVSLPLPEQDRFLKCLAPILFRLHRLRFTRHTVFNFFRSLDMAPAPIMPSSTTNRCIVVPPLVVIIVSKKPPSVVGTSFRYIEKRPRIVITRPIPRHSAYGRTRVMDVNFYVLRNSVLITGTLS